MTPWRQLPLRLAATLAAGLGEKSRSKRRLSGSPPTELVFLAALLDGVNTLSWQIGRGTDENRPARVLDALLGGGEAEEQPDTEFAAFDTAEEVQAALYPETHSAFEEVN